MRVWRALWWARSSPSPSSAVARHGRCARSRRSSAARLLMSSIVSTSATASADSRRLPYWPALDGLRGLSVAAVLLFHGGFGGARGGYLGVSAFFTLSGFLITTLLVTEWRGEGPRCLPRCLGEP